MQGRHHLAMQRVGVKRRPELELVANRHQNMVLESWGCRANVCSHHDVIRICRDFVVKLLIQQVVGTLHEINEGFVTQRCVRFDSLLLRVDDRPGLHADHDRRTLCDQIDERSEAFTESVPSQQSVHLISGKARITWWLNWVLKHALRTSDDSLIIDETKYLADEVGLEFFGRYLRRHVPAEHVETCFG